FQSAEQPLLGQFSVSGNTWVRNLLARKPPNKVACALANKTTRIVWAVLARGGSYNVKQMA
ncbi:hypothetical protein ACOQNR_22600, partial [Pseudomonas juntendi]